MHSLEKKHFQAHAGVAYAKEFANKPLKMAKINDYEWLEDYYNEQNNSDMWEDVSYGAIVTVHLLLLNKLTVNVSKGCI